MIPGNEVDSTKQLFLHMQMRISAQWMRITFKASLCRYIYKSRAFER